MQGMHNFIVWQCLSHVAKTLECFTLAYTLIVSVDSTYRRTPSLLTKYFDLIYLRFLHQKSATIRVISWEVLCLSQLPLKVSPHQINPFQSLS